MWKAILKAIVLAGFRAIAKRVTSEVRKGLSEIFEERVRPGLDQLRVKAAATPEPWDDVGVECLQGLVDGVKIIPLE